MASRYLDESCVRKVRCNIRRSLSEKTMGSRMVLRQHYRRELWFRGNSPPERSSPSESSRPYPRGEGIFGGYRKNLDDGRQRISGVRQSRINEWHEAPGSPLSTLGPSLPSSHRRGGWACCPYECLRKP